MSYNINGVGVLHHNVQNRKTGLKAAMEENRD
jgi:hypothetical protein